MKKLEKSHLTFMLFLVTLLVVLGVFSIFGKKRFINYVASRHEDKVEFLEKATDKKNFRRNNEKIDFTGNQDTMQTEEDKKLEIAGEDPINIGLVMPLNNNPERVTKKPFGIYITPQNSPVQPERFLGYHTGTDFETFDEEKNTDVEIKAICEGNVLEKRFASGYGGVFIQSCNINNSPVTVLYGHLKLESINFQKGQEVLAGQKIGVLGQGNAVETDFERKHLHLAIHNGREINYRGYVSAQRELESWLNPCDVLKCR